MNQRKYTEPILIENIESRIATLLAQGLDEQAEGLITFFKNYVDMRKIHKEKRLKIIVGDC